MTERLYYTDSYATTFSARVVEWIAGDDPASDRSTVAILDRTAFYPTSGGQPHDTGQINSLDVLDVIAREEDGAVLHLLAGDAPALAPGELVEGAIDWPRRFDHMQHHTGQHILTQAFIQTADAPTVSFHLGSEAVTIDLDRPALTQAQLDAAEDLANAIVLQNLPVRAWFPTAGEMDDLSLRKVPDVDGKLRVVSIGDFEHTACGGTHVAHTAEVGPIKVIHAENYKGMTRVEFCCGRRALHDYRRKHAILTQLAAELTTGYWDLPEALDRLRAENKQLSSALRAARQSLLATEAAAMWEGAAPVNGRRIIVGAWTAQERDPAELRPLASHLVERPGTVVLLGVAGEKTQVVMARSADLSNLDMVPLLRGATGRGGGRPEFAQGGGTETDQPALQAALQEAEQAVRAMLQ